MWQRTVGTVHYICTLCGVHLFRPGTYQRALKRRPPSCTCEAWMGGSRASRGWSRDDPVSKFSYFTWLFFSGNLSTLQGVASQKLWKVANLQKGNFVLKKCALVSSVAVSFCAFRFFHAWITAKKLFFNIALWANFVTNKTLIETLPRSMGGWPPAPGSSYCLATQRCCSAFEFHL
jgi:hypothetical protein